MHQLQFSSVGRALFEIATTPSFLASLLPVCPSPCNKTGSHGNLLGSLYVQKTVGLPDIYSFFFFRGAAVANIVANLD
jgi:hypothetical protein